MKTYDERFQDVSMRIRKHRKTKTAIATGCVTMAVVILALVLFVPFNTNPPSVRDYADSPYYDLIQKINAATFQAPEHDNNFGVLMDSFDTMEDAILEGVDDADNSSNAMPESGMDIAGTGTYAEVTDNQVQGVTEADLIKRSTEYIYYLRGQELSVYSIAGADSALVGSYTVAGITEQEKINEYEDFSYSTSAEMYLSADCSTITVVMDGYSKSMGSCTILVNLDVRDPENVMEISRKYITGNYLSSRVADESLLVMNQFRVSTNYDFNDESTFLPRIGEPEDMQCVAADDILYPEELTSTQYTVICKLDLATLEVQDTAAFLSYSDEIYVSRENIFATRSYSESAENGGSSTMTEISCLSYSGETMEFKGGCTLEGSVKDQYSMDEYEGILRVVTSVNRIETHVDGEIVSASWIRNASLYCVSLEDFSIVAAVKEFAPDNEQAESVRFDGETAYVCTAEVITLTDPVYFFDLSDVDNITWTDTGTIDGYSSSLINLGEGYLLGVGYGSEWDLKIEIYEETADSVVSVCAYEADASFSEVYKSYLLDREKDLIGLGVMAWDWDGTTEYVLLHFDGYELHEIARIPMEGALSDMRAVLIDGWLYVFGDSFAVEKVW